MLPINPRLAPKIAAADLIIYAPGTQHSSLFPSYLTTGMAEVIAGNLTALKVLVTNIQTDAEISGSNAVDLVKRAAYYLTNKGRARAADAVPDHALADQRSGSRRRRQRRTCRSARPRRSKTRAWCGSATSRTALSGRHDAARILGPFIAIVRRAGAADAASPCCCTTPSSTNKIAQTLLEMVRGGVADVPVDVTGLLSRPRGARSAARGPAAVRGPPPAARDPASFADAARPGGFDYVLLFESSGMYRGEEIVPLLAQLATGRLDAVWGSRRLSVRDIEESYRFRYQRNAVAGTVSYLGSHVLSLACLVLYGRYITDTLSGVRAMRAADVLDPRVDLTPTGRQSRAARARCCGARRRSSRCRSASSRCRRTASSARRALDGLRAWASSSRIGSAPARQRRAARRVRRRRRGAAPVRPNEPAILVIPAAGLGSRLGRRSAEAARAGRRRADDRSARAALSALRGAHRPDRASLVRRTQCGSTSRAWPLPVDVAVQERPTGMLDAILLGADAVRSTTPRRGVDHVVRSGGGPPDDGRAPGRSADAAHRDAALVMPTVAQRRPYIHLAARRAGRIVAACCIGAKATRCRRSGESDMGLFALSARGVSGRPAAHMPRRRGIGRVTGERNFLPFIPWLAAGDDGGDVPVRSTRWRRSASTRRRSCARVERYLGDRTDDRA